ncbi:MAG: diacylglycerol kinase family protein [Casimicrobiaceae bacterium]
MTRPPMPENAAEIATPARAPVASAIPSIDRSAPLQFVINAGSGSGDTESRRSAIEAALRAGGRKGNLRLTNPDEIVPAAQAAAREALQLRSAVVAVGGDGTINAVAQAAHRTGCVMGVVPQGTFNFFARMHGIPQDPGDATSALLNSQPAPVQVGMVNDRVFLVNASIGLYPELLEDRESFKARFGRNRLVAFLSMLTTLLTNTRQLRLRIELDGVSRDVRTRTLFVGNNRLQLEQLGLTDERSYDNGHITAVMLRPIGALAMLGLVARGAVGSLGDADAIESFRFQRMSILVRRVRIRRHLKVAFDGEVAQLTLPLEFRVASTPLYLLKPAIVDSVAP